MPATKSTKFSNKSKMTIKEASIWATDYLDKDISPTNISYLIQYGKVKKHGLNGATLVDINELKKYYQSWRGGREIGWKKQLGDDLNWALSFDDLRERETTKHVHRLHPYKGKFIPQLVAYFIDSHKDKFKKHVYFRPNDILLDPFCGSGTSLVQANELGMHAIGIDISHFNCMISSVKLGTYDFESLRQEIEHIKSALVAYEHDMHVSAFEAELAQKLNAFNKEHFPSVDFKYALAQGKIDETAYAKEKEKQFLKTYKRLLKKHGVELEQKESHRFLDKWYCKTVRKEIDFVFARIQKMQNPHNKQVLSLILSRTLRSCRATKHYDLATLKQPQRTTYYCWKHKKICKPLYSIKYWFGRYANDTMARLQEFAALKTEAHVALLPADARSVDIFAEVKKRNKAFYKSLAKQKIRGIFSSPPYVGQIDYHEQHAYAYELFGFARQDELEIGPLYKGQGVAARRSYVEGIASVLANCKKFLAADYDIFLVANDKYNLYPQIADKAGMQIVNKFKRPVLNRTERSRTPYAEIIFHLKEPNIRFFVA